jgi:tRNA(Ser,Leu) C12 N-acetylase TAN1
MSDWNVLATTAEGKYNQALAFLVQFGTVKPTAYYNVVMLRVQDVPGLLAFLAMEWEAQGGQLKLLQRVAPMDFTFNFSDREMFARRAAGIARDWAPRLTGKTFHVRMHRRGFKEQMSSEQEEQLLNAVIVEATTQNGRPAVVAYDDPDAVAAVETIGSHAGISLWFREDLQRYPFLKIH